MSEERKEYPFDVKFDESALKPFNYLIKEKGIRHFKLESDLYGILDVVSYEEYEKLQQKVEQLEKENKELNRMCELYSQSLYNADLTKAEKKVEQLENIRKEAIGYVTSYESISTIQGLDDIEKNKNLDEKTMNEMINRYLKVHDILLNILNKVGEE